jgi:hypothetical protein
MPAIAGRWNRPPIPRNAAIDAVAPSRTNAATGRFSTRSPRLCRMSASEPLAASAATAKTAKTTYFTGNREDFRIGTMLCKAG